MKDFIFALLIIFIMWIWISAIFHEKDLSRNFNNTGNAKAWFCEIKEKETKMDVLSLLDLANNHWHEFIELCGGEEKAEETIKFLEKEAGFDD